MFEIQELSCDVPTPRLSLEQFARFDFLLMIGQTISRCHIFKKTSRCGRHAEDLYAR